MTEGGRGRVGVPGGLADLGTTGWGGEDAHGQRPVATSDLRQQQRQLIRGETGSGLVSRFI